MARVFCLDVSSSTIGWSVIDRDVKITLVDCGYIKPIKHDSLMFRLKDTKKKIIDLLDKYNPDDVAIEEIAFFMAGKSTSKSILILCTFNRMIGLAVYEHTGKEPSFYNVVRVRHGIKTGKSAPKKEDIPSVVERHLGIKFPWAMKKNRKGETVTLIENYDVADSIAVGLYHILKK